MKIYSSMMIAAALSVVPVAGAFQGGAQPQSSAPQPQAQKAPEVETWGDEFNGSALDADKWENFSLGGGGTVKVEKGELRMRGTQDARAGVRSKAAFTSERYIVEGKVAKVGPAMPKPGETGAPIGNAILCLLFDTSGRNRIEWLITSEGTMEAWYVRDGNGERLDNRKLATREKQPMLGIVRRGDEFLFMLNGEQGAKATLVGVPRTFHVMLYGYSSSENNWDSLLVRSVKSAQ